MPLVGPEPFDSVAVGVDPVPAADGRSGALDRYGGLGIRLADVMAGIAAIGHHPRRHARRAIEQPHGVGKLMHLTGRSAEDDGTAHAVSDHAALSAIAAT